MPGSDRIRQEGQGGEEEGEGEGLTDGSLSLGVLKEDAQSLQELHLNGGTRLLLQDFQEIGVDVLFKEKAKDGTEKDPQ